MIKLLGLGEANKASHYCPDAKITVGVKVGIVSGIFYSLYWNNISFQMR